MTPATAPASNPPVAKKVIAGFLGYGVALAIQALIPGYHPDPLVAQLIDGAIGTASAFVVREETKYLVPALQKARKYENGVV
jgi:hypothetical protein